MFFMQTAIRTASIFLPSTKNILHTPWQYSRFLRGLGLYLCYTSHSHDGHALSRRRALARRGEATLYIYTWDGTDSCAYEGYCL